MIFSVAKLATLVSIGLLCFSSIARALAAGSDIGTNTSTSTSTSIFDAAAADIIASSSSTGMATSSSFDVLQTQTSRLLGDSYDQIVDQQMINQLRNKLNDWSAVAAANRQNFADAYEYEFLQRAWDSATAYLSPQQLQIINDAVSMLSDSYAYDAAQREITLHKDCIAAAYQHLSSAAKIALNSDYGDGQQLVEHILSAVQQLQDSCPLCRALKMAATEANRNLLPFVTVLSTSILKSLHPFLDSSQLDQVPL